jgi:deazaflavin-dependent oxidoreductase (nitroreductase family)
MPHQLDRWMYSGGRPNRAARFLNGIWRRAAAAGLPPKRLAALEVRGRRSGRLRSFPVVVADHDGQRYLVAMLGDSVNWVANVRTAGGHAVLRHGRQEAVRLKEVEPAARAPILKCYLELAPGARAHIPVGPGADLADFEPIAARYAVFRVAPAERLRPNAK